MAYAEDEVRESFHEAMEWPEVVTEELRSAQDQSARHAAQLIGADNVDAMVMRAWDAHVRKLAESAEGQSAVVDSNGTGAP